MSNKAERLRKAYEFKLGKAFVSKLSDDQLKILSKYYNSLSDSEQSDLDNKIFKGHTDTDLHEMARGMMEEVEEEVAPPPPPPKVTAIVPSKFFGEERYEKYVQEINENGTIDGQPLTPSERKEAFKKRKSKIDFKNFVDKVLEKKAEAAAIGGDGDTAAAPGARKFVVPAQKLLPGTADLVPDLKPDKEEEKKTAEVKEDVDNIDEKLDTLLSEIREENKEEKKSTEKKRVEKERERRKKKENRLESAKKFLVAPITKALQPIGNIFQKIFDGILKLIFTKALIKLIDWFTDPSNKKKVDSIVRFIKDFWPAIIAGFLIIGSGLGGLVTSIMGVTAKLVLRLLGLTAKLGIAAARLAGKGLGKGLRFAAKNPVVTGLVVGGALAAGGAYAASQQNEEQRKKEKKESPEATVTPEETKKTGKTPGTQQLMRESILQRGIQGFSNGGQPIFPVQAMGTDTVPAMLTPGETVLQPGARERQIAATGVDPLDFNVGSNANRPKIMNGITYAADGGSIEVKGTGNTVEGTLKMKDAAGKQVGKTYGVISGTYAGMNVPQNARSTTRNAPIPDGNYKLLGFEKHGPYPGLPGIGHWSAFINNSSGSIGSRSGLMIHNDIGSNGTLGCIGVELGGTAGTKAEKEFLQAYQQVNPQTIKVALMSGGGNAGEIASIDRTPSPDNSERVAALQPAQSATLAPGSSTGDANAQALMSYLIRLSRLPSVGQQGMTPVSNIGATSQPIGTNGSDVPQLGSLDPNNNSLLVMKSMYNIVGS